MNIFGYILIALLCAPYYIAVLNILLSITDLIKAKVVNYMGNYISKK